MKNSMVLLVTAGSSGGSPTLSFIHAPLFGQGPGPGETYIMPEGSLICTNRGDFRCLPSSLATITRSIRCGIIGAMVLSSSEVTQDPDLLKCVDVMFTVSCAKASSRRWAE